MSNTPQGRAIPRRSASLLHALVAFCLLFAPPKLTLAASSPAAESGGGDDVTASEAGGDAAAATTTTTPSTVAITIQRSTDPSLELSNVVAHVACFDDIDNVLEAEEYGGDNSEARSSCCAAVWRTVVRTLCSDAAAATAAAEKDSISSLLPNHNLCRMGMTEQRRGPRSSWERLCMERIALIPPIVRREETNIVNNQVPTHVLSIWDQQPAHSQEDNEGLGLDWQYVWDFASGTTGRWISGASSPFRLAVPSQSNDDTTKTMLPAKVISTVSESGGMHRAHHHKLILSLATIDGQPLINASGKVTVLLPLSEGTFVDIDDALQDDGKCTVSARSDSPVLQEDSKCHAQMVALPHGTVVDIEQPSFASQQHVLAVQVAFELLHLSSVALNNKEDEVPDIELEFASNLHLRYPPPITDDLNTDASKSKRISSVYIPSAFIGGGQIEMSSNTSTDADGVVGILLVQGGVQRDVIVLEAAAGHDGDYIFVVLATLIASIIGSFVMIRDISRVSSWN